LLAVEVVESVAVQVVVEMAALVAVAQVRLEPQQDWLLLREQLIP
jgi:hypothetical protein